MLKVLCVVIILVVPIFCNPIEGGKRKTAIQRILDNVWTEKCKNVSGITIDIDRNDRIYLDYKNCTTAINENDIRNDVMSIFPKFDLNKMDNFLISHQQKTDLVALSRRYCPKVDAAIDCKEIMNPIYNECYNAEEREGQKVEKEVHQSLHNYFCTNESDAVSRLIDGKFVECAMEKNAEILECYQVYALSFFNMDAEFSIFSMLPKADKLCRSIDTLGQCLVPLFDQCTLSQTVGGIVSSMFSTVLGNTTCRNFTSK